MSSSPKDRVELEAGPDIIPPTLDVPEIPRSMIETGVNGIGVDIQGETCVLGSLNSLAQHY